VTGILVQTVSRLLLAPSLALAVAILVKGYAQVGDGFAAGVVAALAILLQLLAFGREAVERALPVEHAFRLALGGLGLALAVGFAPVLWGEAIVTHYPRPGADVVHLGTVELLTAVLFDCGIFLLVVGVAVGAIGLLARLRDEVRPG
jgi:multisubunit Na+/H+ antiporter MnhB subunit